MIEDLASSCQAFYHDLMRLFTAIDLPRAMKQQLANTCFGLANTRWTEPEQLHISLTFIGEVNPALLHEIEDQLANIQFPAFDLQCQGIDSFRSGVLWLAVKPNPSLLELERSIRKRLKRISEIELKGHHYKPHITLGRMDRKHLPNLEHFISLNSTDCYEFKINDFALKSSLLKPKGAIHKLERRFYAS